MRKILFIALLLMGVTSFAQDNIGVILKGGTVVQSYGSNLFNNTKGLNSEVSKFGYYFGASYEIPIKENLFIEPGLFYNQVKSEAVLNEGYLVGHVNNQIVNHKETITHRKLQLPIMAKRRFEHRRVNTFLGLGLFAETTLRNDVYAEFHPVFGNHSREIDAFFDFEFGLQFETGFEFKNFVLGARFSNGFYNTQFTLKNSFIGLYLGFII